MSSKRTFIWIAIVVAAAAITASVMLAIRHFKPRWSVIEGAVIRSDPDTRKQLPLAGVTITASHGGESLTAQSDAAGYYRIAFPGTVLPGQTVTVRFTHPDYRPLDLNVTFELRSAPRPLTIAAMVPNAIPSSPKFVSAQTVISNIKVRYTVNSQSEENIGSMVKTFQVVNRGDIACHRQDPCSPDGNWKAAKEMVEMDAGAGNEFRDARASCIAGPCPFTRLDLDGFVDGNRTISATAMDWSDTATFLVEAEVYRTAIESNVRESYPFIFGTELNFTVPSSAEGVSFEAELNGEAMVFPLGPDLYLSWASCSSRSGSEAGKSTVYQCSLKSGYRF